MTGLRAWLAHQPDGYRIPIGRVLAIYAGLMLVIFLSSTDQTIVSTALPTIVTDIGGLSQYSWIFSAYLLAATVSVPLYGKLGDVYGKRRVLVVAISLFLSGSALCGIARSMSELIAFRAVQGLGAGGLVPLALATIGSIVPLRDRGRYQGLIVAAFAGGAGAGPLLGGFLVDQASWPWIFYVNIPFGLLALLVVLTTMSNPSQRVSRPVDWPGAAALAGASTCLMLGLLWAGRQFSWSSPEVLGVFGATACLTVAFVLAERRAAEPILFFEALRMRTVACSVVCYALGGMVTVGVISFLPLFVQGVLGGSATRSGLALWPQFLGGSLASIVTGQWIARRGQLRPTALIGPLFMTAGVLLLSRLSVGASSSDILRATLLIGVGWGMMAQVFILSVQNAVPRSMITSATALVIFSRSMGAALGVAGMGAIVNRGLPSGTTLDPSSLGAGAAEHASRALLADAIAPAFLVAAFVAVLVLPVAVYGVRNVPLRRSVDGEPGTEVEPAATTAG